ncbi:hypothetical protein WG66_003192 [Moniliophthora roreri]|nr:hypothetical protein WG66_003192 [Moniliophthora roreri]
MCLLHQTSLNLSGSAWFILPQLLRRHVADHRFQQFKLLLVHSLLQRLSRQYPLTQSKRTEASPPASSIVKNTTPSRRSAIPGNMSQQTALSSPPSQTLTQPQAARPVPHKDHLLARRNTGKFNCANINGELYRVKRMILFSPATPQNGTSSTRATSVALNNQSTTTPA